MAIKDINGDLHSEANGRFVSKSASELKSELQKEISEKSISTKSPTSKMTPAEKIASVHIDFDRDNILPELNEEDLEKIGVEQNKLVLLKKDVIDRNAKEHDDLTNNDFQSIIGQALYQPSEIFPANEKKPYFHFAKIIEENSKGKPEYGLVILDVDNNKDNFEIVHAQFMRKRSYNSLRKRQ